MTLMPIQKRQSRMEPVFKSANPDFNARAAHAAYELVMKMDEDEAREFTSIVVADVLEETIEKNLRTLQSHLDRVVSKRIDRVKQATLRAVSKNDTPEALAFAQALTEIEKAKDKNKDKFRAQRDPYARSLFNQQHPRSQGGQFTTKITHSQTKALKPKTARALGIKNPPDDMPKEHRAQYQDEYRQLANFLGSVHQSTQNPGDTKIYLYTREKATGQEGVRTMKDTVIDSRKGKLPWDPETEELIGATARPTSLNIGGATFALTNALNGRAGEDERVRTGTINRFKQEFPQFSDDWTKDHSGEVEYTRNSNAALYNRINTGSKFLGAVAPYSTKAQVAAEFGRFVGEHGPQAEAVIGPTARKTAYRYRGTEKKPDPTIVRAYEQAVTQAKTQTAGDARGLRQIAVQREKAVERAPSFEEQEAGRAALVKELRDRMPQKGNYGLHLASGHTPPSEGVMINAEGQITTQAIGYADDHYLPFNLKNLKGLKGGQYVRTRSVGGPTSEDIYTALIAGARQVTVVSRSGTFTITFEDDFRGGRRHNDKARRMVRRYEEILDAVQSEQVERQDIPPRWRKRIETEVREDLGPKASRSLVRETVRERINEFKNDPEIDPQDEARAEAMIREMEHSDAPLKDKQDYRAQIYSELSDMKEVKFRLNGMGYGAALKTLEEQFPYYIKTNYAPRRELERVESEKDKGFVEAGRNRPTEANAGSYGTAIRLGQGKGNSGTGFISASQTNYQGGLKQLKLDKEKVAEGEGETPETKDGKKVKPVDQMREQIAEETKKRGVRKSAVELAQAIAQASTDVPSPRPVWWGKQPEEQAELFKKPENLTALSDFVKQNEATLERSSALRTKMSAFKAAVGSYGGAEYKKSLGTQWNSVPFVFKDRAAYKETAKPEEVQAELNRIDRNHHGVATSKPLSGMSMAELQGEVDLIGLAKDVRAGIPEGKEAEQQFLNAMSERAADPDSAWFKNAMRSEEAMDEQLEAVHRARALLAKTTPEQREAAEGATPGHPARVPSTDHVQWRTGQMIEQARAVAEHFKGTEPFKAQKLNDFADELERQKDGVTTDAKLRAIQDANEQAVKLIQEGYASTNWDADSGIALRMQAWESKYPDPSKK